jgi:hypothetical protein
MPRATSPRRPGLAGASILLLAAAAPAAAQPTPPAPPRLDRDAVVRVDWPAGGPLPERLWVAGQRGDTLDLYQRGRPEMVWSVPLADVRRLDVSRGHRSRAGGAGKGALIGLAVGAAATGAIYFAASAREPGCTECYAGLVTFFLGGATTAATTVLGAIIGYARAGDRWERVRLPGASASVRPAPGGAAVAVRLAF